MPAYFRPTTLDAKIELASRDGRRTVPIDAFVTGYRRTVCRPDEIVTAIVAPKGRAGAQGRFLKLGARRYLVISIAMAAGVVAADEDGTITAARIAVGACSPVARRLVTLEAALERHSLDAAADIVTPDHLAPLSPIDDVRASGAYRQAAALDLVRDLLAGFALDRSRRAA